MFSFHPNKTVTFRDNSNIYRTAHSFQLITPNNYFVKKACRFNKYFKIRNIERTRENKFSSNFNFHYELTYIASVKVAMEKQDFVLFLFGHMTRTKKEEAPCVI